MPSLNWWTLSEYKNLLWRHICKRIQLQTDLVRWPVECECCFSQGLLYCQAGTMFGKCLTMCWCETKLIVPVCIFWKIASTVLSVNIIIWKRSSLVPGWFAIKSTCINENVQRLYCRGSSMGKNHRVVWYALKYPKSKTARLRYTMNKSYFLNAYSGENKYQFQYRYFSILPLTWNFDQTWVLPEEIYICKEIWMLNPQNSISCNKVKWKGGESIECT